MSDDLFPSSPLDRGDPLYFASGQYQEDLDAPYQDDNPGAWKRFFLYLTILAVFAVFFSVL